MDRLGRRIRGQVRCRGRGGGKGKGRRDDHGESRILRGRCDRMTRIPPGVTELYVVITMGVRSV